MGGLGPKRGRGGSLVVRLKQVHMRRASNCKISVTGAVSSVGQVVNSPLVLI
jgi:hypothetical protein